MDENRKKQLLIVEDDEDMRKEIKRMFEDEKEIGFVVTTATNLEEGEKCLKERAFDVAIIDMRLQENVYGGIKILEKALEDFRIDCPKLLPIIYTAYPDYEICVKAMRYGAWDYIDKNSEDSMNKLKQSVKEGLTKRFSSETGPDSHFIEQHLKEWKKYYANRFIALIDEEIKGDGIKIDELKDRMRKEYPDKKPYYLFIPQPW